MGVAGKRLTPSLPIAGATASMSDSNNLNRVRKFTVDYGVGKLTKNKFASVRHIGWPAMRGLTDQLDCTGNLLFKTKGNELATIKIPVHGREEFERGVFLKLNLFCGHAGIWRKPVLARLARELFLLRRSRQRKCGERFLPAKATLRRGRRRTPGSRAEIQSVRLVLPRSKSAPAGEVRWSVESYAEYTPKSRRNGHLPGREATFDGKFTPCEQKAKLQWG
jgi:hypothetical protein